MIILSIIIFKNKHIGYYSLFDFYLNSLFTVNYNCESVKNVVLDFRWPVAPP